MKLILTINGLKTDKDGRSSLNGHEKINKNECVIIVANTFTYTLTILHYWSLIHKCLLVGFALHTDTNVRYTRGDKSLRLVPAIRTRFFV